LGARTVGVVAEEAELAKAVEGREHWTLDGPAAAVYAPPEASSSVRIRSAVHAASVRERYAATIMEDGRAAHVTRWPTAVSAVMWAERVKLS
jgi:hypothetical protein